MPAATGICVIGTVEGDLHDIGKNLVAMMLAGAGWKVVNLGTGVTPAQFVAAVRDNKRRRARHERPADHDGPQDEGRRSTR